MKALPWKDFLAGLFMGIASLLPSFSAGTAALITGRYEFLLECIDQWRNILAQPVKHKEFILRGSLLGLGIIAAISLLAPILQLFLRTGKPYLLSFFAGLIFATTLCFLPSKKELRKPSVWLFILGGCALIFATRLITAEISLTVITAPFLAILAVTAMLLPGVSGSYMLLVVGAYQAMIDAITNPIDHVVLLVVFFITAVIYAEIIASSLHYVITTQTRRAYQVILGMLVAGGIILLTDISLSFLTSLFFLVGIATYPLLDHIQTNKR